METRLIRFNPPTVDELVCSISKNPREKQPPASRGREMTSAEEADGAQFVEATPQIARRERRGMRHDDTVRQVG